jgi:hypothetical protein
MTYEHIAIVSLLALQAATLFILYDTHKAGEWFRKAWLRDSAELLYWKRTRPCATLRQAATSKRISAHDKATTSRANGPQISRIVRQRMAAARAGR